MTTISKTSSKQESSALANRDNTAAISYNFNFERFNEHLVDVTLSFTAHVDAPKLWLPAWIPGSYLIREFARHITAVHYNILATDAVAVNAEVNTGSDANSKNVSESYRGQKIDKHTWQLPAVKAGQKLSVAYEVYCYDLSVRTAYVDQQRLYGNFTSLALAIEGQEQSAVQVSLLVPAAFLSDKDEAGIELACGLKASHLQSVNQRGANRQGYGIQADSYYQLIDHPFEIASQSLFNFIIQDDSNQTLSHRFFISGKHSANTGRLQQDITQICQTYLNWLGDAPFSHYTFMTYASAQDYGGLEHINSTSLITPRRDLPSSDEPEIPSSDYQRFLGLCSHEYFHSWWVKTVSPDVMIDVDLRREAFTPLLWVFEGFTSYVDDFMLQASEVIDKASYLVLLAEQISRYYQTEGRAQQSVAESSFDAWIKLYRSDENTANAGISYYNKGALVALCLDLTLLEKSAGQYRLFDVVKAFYAQAKQQGSQRIGISSADMGRVISQFMPQDDWVDFESRYINGVEELPIERLLSANGIKMQVDSKDSTDKKVPWGLRCTETPAGLKVNRVQRGSPAALAGISAHDIIIALDDIKADNKQLVTLATAKHNAEVRCHLFRRDELICVTVRAVKQPDKQDSLQDLLSASSIHKVNLRFNKDDNGAKDDVEASQAPAWQTWLDVLSAAKS